MTKQKVVHLKNQRSSIVFYNGSIFRLDNRNTDIVKETVHKYRKCNRQGVNVSEYFSHFVVNYIYVNMTCHDISCEMNM